MFNKFSEKLVDASTGGGGSAYPGGSTGQILTKDSATDYDASWQTWSPVFQFGGTLTNNELVLGAGPNLIKVLGTLGTAGQVLHGNAAGAPTFSPVDLSFDVTGNLPVTNLNSGTSASATTFWRGDGTWATPASGGSLGPVTPSAVVLGDTTTTVKSLSTLGTTGYVLTANSGGDPYWAAVPAPSGSFSVYVAAANFIQNGCFQVRNRTTQSSVDLVYGDYVKVADRWFAYTDNDYFRTLIDSGNDNDYIAIKRYSGTDDLGVRLVQIFDTEDSLKLANQQIKLSYEARAKAVTLGLDYFQVHISTGDDIDGSVQDYLDGNWTNQTIEASSTVLYGMSSSWVQFEFGFQSTWSATKQIAIEFEIYFTTTADATNDELHLRNITLSDFFAGVRHETKSLAITKQECNRYYQELDLYLTDSYISVPINMREIPTITISPADAFTTTGTTKDTLIIKVDSSSDNGIHTVYLDSELG